MRGSFGSMGNSNQVRAGEASLDGGTPLLEYEQEQEWMGSTSAEIAIACVAQARDDVTCVVQLRIERGGDNRHIGM